MEDKVAVITGGASGIGLAYAEALLTNKIRNIFILDVNEKLAKQETKKLKKKYRKNGIEYLQLDVRNSKQFEEVVKEILKKVSQIDIFINNAGVIQPELTIPVNLGSVGTLNGINLALKYMGKNQGAQGGFVVNTASVAGLAGMPVQPAYAASKWGVIGLTKSLGKPIVFERTAIKFMSICPGATLTSIGKTLPKESLDMSLFKPEELNIKRTQSTKFVADALIKAINENINGAIWVAENCEEPYRVELPEYTTLRVNKKD